jgi:hypothetical protein
MATKKRASAIRSVVESRMAPNLLVLPVAFATAPSNESKKAAKMARRPAARSRPSTIRAATAA